jgi:plasmid stabilization system protein ParE
LPPLGCGMAVADRLQRRIGKKLDFLGKFPEMGSPRPELAPSARMLVEANSMNPPRNPL